MAKRKICVVCGCDMYRKWAYVACGKKVICYTCGMAGYVFHLDGSLFVPPNLNIRHDQREEFELRQRHAELMREHHREPQTESEGK